MPDPTCQQTAPIAPAPRFGHVLAVALIAGIAAGCQSNEGAVLAGEPAATRPYTIRLEKGTHWLVDPAGRRFFSFGVNCVNRGETNDPAGLAAYNSAGVHSSDAAWAGTTGRRLQAWGVTTIGGWSDWGLIRGTPGSGAFAHTPVLHIGAAAGAPWRDLWSPRWDAVMNEQARAHMASFQGDSQTLGRYADNELGWWNGALFRETLDHPPDSGQRQRLIQLLRDEYENDWNRLLTDFEAEGVNSFNELERGGQVYLRAGGSGIRVCRRFLEMIARRYYELSAAAIRRRDHRGLLLGDRYASSYYPELVRAAAAELDVISTNLKASWNDGSFARFYLDTLHELSGKPVIIGEIYFAAMENTSGNRNRNGGFPTAPTQRERAEGFRRSLGALAALPYVVGADWFQYYDEPPAGRYDGEDFNMGLVDIHDRPYELLVSAAARLEPAAIHRSAGTRRASARQGVPPAPANPDDSWRPREALQKWDRERGFIPPASKFPGADLYVCWTPTELLLGLYAMDMTEREYYRDRKVPEADRMRWQIELAGLDKPLSIRLGSSGHEVNEERGTAGPASFRTLAYETRAVAMVSIPANLLGKESLRSGDRVEIKSTLDSHARAERTEWQGKFRLK